MKIYDSFMLHLRIVNEAGAISFGWIESNTTGIDTTDVMFLVGLLR
jgi:hypothetical protein